MKRSNNESQFCQCDCGCSYRATCTDESGVPVCDLCADYTMIAGDVYCSRQSEGWANCPICKSTICWEGYETGPLYGTCDCGEDRWHCDDVTGTDVHRYIED